MLNWKHLQPTLKETPKPVLKLKKTREDIVGDMTQKDMQDTQSEFYSVDNEMWGMVKDLTLDQRVALNKIIDTYCTQCEQMG